MTETSTTIKYDPELHKGNLLESFNEFVKEFSYAYEARAKKQPPDDLDAAGRRRWLEADRRKMFLGSFATRNLQKQLEEVSTENERSVMTFTEVCNRLRERFRLSSNTTLSNFNFRKILQKEDETFDHFVMRVRDAAAGCSFRCGNNCDVVDTMCRDQIIFGTTSEETRRLALHEQWNLENLVARGRSLEAATQGAAKIKTESGIQLKDEGEAYRTKPKKYSRKFSQKKSEASPRDNAGKQRSGEAQCDTCTASFCKGGRACRGLTVTCYTCQKKGHYQGARVCKMKHKSKEKYSRTRNSRRLENDETTDDDSKTESYSSSDDEDSSDDRDERQTKRVGFRRRPITTVNWVKPNGTDPPRRGEDRRSPSPREIRDVRRRKQPKENRYEVKVIVNGHTTMGFADTGAEINIMSLNTAKRLKLSLQKTRMRIRPYGSKSKACRGCYTGTIMHGDAVANATIYVINKPVETLLSGATCEQLGIISFQQAKVAHVVAPTDQSKAGLLTRYPSIFDGVGTLKNYQVTLHTDKNVKPVCQPARPIPFHLRKKCEQELREMEAEGIIEEHSGPCPWLSNLVLSPKDDGGTRITVDMREPNKCIKPTNIPIVRPEEIKAQLSQYKVFSKLDFKQAFHQLPLDEESRKLTVFHAGNRLMRYTRLTMGCMPASGELSKALRPLFAGKTGIHVIHDDVIIGGKTQDIHDSNLEIACKTVQDAGMTLNIEKCIIGKTSIPWFGMIISDKGISPDPTKVQALRHATPPTNKDEVLSFLCMINSHKDFIPNLAGKTAHMRQLTKKHVRFQWSDECQEEFAGLCKELKTDTMLRHYDPKKPTFIFVDAHRTGISAILAQGDSVESATPVAYASRATTAVEARYPQLDIEALSIDYGLRRFRFYLVGGPSTVVVTDHKPLEAIFRNSRSGSIRTERIKLRHQDIKYEVKWRKGKENPADYTSRHSTPRDKIPKEERRESQELEKTVWLVNFSPYTEAVSMEKIIKHTREDPTLQQVIKAVKKGFMDKQDQALYETYRKVFHEISISDEGLLMRGEKIILPATLIEKAMRKAHQGSHPGMSSMKRRVRTHFWFPKMDTHIEKFIQGCEDCTIFTNKKTHGQIHPQSSAARVWDNVHIDLFGPMPDSRHVLVATDSLSRFPAAKIVPDTSAEKVIKSLDQIYNDFGQPLTHRSDNGPPFNSEAFKKYSNDNGISHVKTFPYHPQANNAETFMKPLGKTMKIAHHHRQDKSQALNSLLANYRATPHTSTGMAPGDVLFRHGYRADGPQRNAIPEEELRHALNEDHERRRRRSDQMNASKYRNQQQLHPGDVVITRNNKRTSKFQPLFDPTPRIVEHTEPGGATCMAADGTIQRRHIDDIKPIALNDDPTQVVVNEEVGESSTAEERDIVEQDPAILLKIPSPQQIPRRSTREKKPIERYGDWQC